MTLRVELVDSPFGFSALTEEWNAALGRSDGASVFFTHGWLRGLTAEIPAFWEVVGEAALLVDPVSVEALRNGLEGLIEDVSLRYALGERAVRRDAEFSRERTARETPAVFEKVVEGGHE